MDEWLYPVKQYYIIACPHPNSNGGLEKPPFACLPEYLEGR